MGGVKSPVTTTRGAGGGSGGMMAAGMVGAVPLSGAGASAVEVWAVGGTGLGTAGERPGGTCAGGRTWTADAPGGADAGGNADAASAGARRPNMSATKQAAAMATRGRLDVMAVTFMPYGPPCQIQIVAAVDADDAGSQTYLSATRAQGAPSTQAG